ncbi:hypothetical protein LCGC14_1016130 [marine sediment metagenome]|uniref:Uncharacterized protein n=1 Tax=marine sediment metagenome TaxID=412755 RepID=A0A0F9N3D6_9ZZZZ
MIDPWLKEQIQTSRNLCEIALILIEIKRGELLPTVLELLHYYTQTIIDKHCIKELNETT